MNRRGFLGVVVSGVIISAGGFLKFSKQSCDPIRRVNERVGLSPSEAWSTDLQKDYVYFEIVSNNNQVLEISLFDKSGKLVEVFETTSKSALYRFSGSSGELRVENLGTKSEQRSEYLVDQSIELRSGSQFSFDIRGDENEEISYEIRDSLESSQKLQCEIVDSSGSIVMETTVEGYVTDSFVLPESGVYTVNCVSTGSESVEWDFVFTTMKEQSVGTTVDILVHEGELSCSSSQMQDYSPSPK